MRRRAVAACAVLPIAGCALALPRLPAPDAGLRRALVAPASTRCRGSRCVTSVRVDGRLLRVESRTRTVAAEALTGRSAGSLGQRALVSARGALLRRLGATTSTFHVGLGTRRIADPAGALDLVCDVAWIDEETRARDAARAELTRRAEGAACTASARADSGGARWRLRLGSSPARDSLALVVDALERGATDAAPGDVPLAIERVAGTGGAAAQPYVVVADARRAEGSGPFDVGARRWVVRRPDGTLVGVIHHAAIPRTAIDIGAAADAEEAELLRAIGAGLAEPLSHP